MKRIPWLPALLLSFFLLGGCISSPYYQKDISIRGNAWSQDQVLRFPFVVEDTASYYHIYFLTRHTDAYPFSNIWMWVYTLEPDSQLLESRIEVPLADPAGRWLGRGMGEIWEHRMPITRNDKPMKFLKPGNYEIRFEQNMRLDPLPEILQVGLRIEKAQGPLETPKIQ